jgi:hypothetical protein
MANQYTSDTQLTSSHATSSHEPVIQASSSLAPISQTKQLECQSARVDIAFYLPNTPAFPANWHLEQANAIEKLIQLNGNHWRKIFTIMAKLCCTQSPQSKAWQQVRATLFSSHQPNSYQPTSLSKRLHMGATTIDPLAKWHIICGQQAREDLGLTLWSKPAFFDEQEKVSREQYHLFTPYLDYRQFPNRLIEQVHSLIHS